MVFSVEERHLQSHRAVIGVSVESFGFVHPGILSFFYQPLDHSEQDNNGRDQLDDNDQGAHCKKSEDKNAAAVNLGCCGRKGAGYCSQ
jgi:hypothetical protein